MWQLDEKWKKERKEEKRKNSRRIGHGFSVGHLGLKQSKPLEGHAHPLTQKLCLWEFILDIHKDFAT